MENTPENTETVSVQIGFEAPHADLFMRGEPVGRFCPPEYWAAAHHLVDHGNFILLRNKVRPEERMRDLVMAALLRRALITTEAVTVNLYNGLAEPAVGLTRVLVDIELSAKLVSQDATGKYAKLLGGFSYRSSQQHGQRILGDPQTRRGIAERDPDQLDWLKGAARSYAKHFQSPVFDEVRSEVKAGGAWHGMTPEDAFRQAGNSHDYFSSYDLGSLFIHASNLDFDFVERDGEARIRSMVERDPRRIRPLLAMALHRLLSVMKMFVGEEPWLNLKDGTTAEVNTLTGYSQLLLDTFEALPEEQQEASSSIQDDVVSPVEPSPADTDDRP